MSRKNSREAKMLRRELRAIKRPVYGVVTQKWVAVPSKYELKFEPVR